MADLKSVNEETFETEVLHAAKPTVVDFWAEWCSPCKALAPVLDEIQSEVGEKAQIVKVNIDHASELAAKYGIRGIPTLIFFKDGEVKNTLVGNFPKAEILSSLNELL